MNLPKSKEYISCGACKEKIFWESNHTYWYRGFYDIDENDIGEYSPIKTKIHLHESCELPKCCNCFNKLNTTAIRFNKNGTYTCSKCVNN
jgi:hypothetical protein